MSKLITVCRLFFSDRRKFVKRLKNEISAPTTLAGSFIRKFYLIFYSKKSSSPNLNENRLLFVYDTLLNPITFDFMHYLYIADWVREKTKIKYIDLLLVLRDGFSEGLEEEYILSIGRENLKWRINNLITPSARLFSSIDQIYSVHFENSDRIIDSYANIYPRGYSYSSPKTAIARCDQYGLGFQSCLSISKSANLIINSYFPIEDARLIVTITLRSYDYIKCRNSDISSWVKFASGLDSKRYRVVFIPDASTSGIETFIQLKPFDVFDSACWSLELRAALYERAWMNMGVACGPLTISGLLPNVWTVMIDRSLDYPEDYRKNVYSTGMTPGCAPQFYSKNCSFFHGKDDVSTLNEIFSKYIGKMPEE